MTGNTDDPLAVPDFQDVRAAHERIAPRIHLTPVLTSEAEIIDAMRLIWQRMKIIIEPSRAVPLAAILSNPDVFAGQRVGVILS